MVELKATSPAAGLLPLRMGGVEVAECDLGHLTSIATFDAAETGKVLEKAHGLALPGPLRSTETGGARCLWFGHREVLLIGPAPDPALAEHAAVVDQSDGWTCVTVKGAGAADVLARLVPVDVRERAFPTGHTMRSLVFHMNASITRLSADQFLVLVFRSMAGTLVHDLKQAMEAIAARR
ncbi:MAG: sarcosine oxidase subunit gamma family protein [Pseudomonadota bacterium]